LIKTATPAGGQALSMEYSLHGKRTKLTDPDAGTIETKYNGFGELVEEKQKIHSASAWITTTNNYAPTTGLLQSIVRNGETTTYAYDSSLGHPGRIQSITLAGQHKQSFTYDDLGRTVNVKEEFDGQACNLGTEYDALGRVKKEIYPSGYYTLNHYDSKGLFYKVTDRDGRHIWEAKTENARGQLLSEKKGNKETTYIYYDTGRPKFIYASGIIDNWYQFDGRGNLIYRDEYAISDDLKEENFDYDNMNRLTGGDISSYEEGSTFYSLSYDAQGNIQTKSDLGNVTMNYGANNKPHALASLSGVPANFPASNLNVTYTDFKKIEMLEEGNKFYYIMYGVDDQRRKSVYADDDQCETRYYVGDYEEKINDFTGAVQKIHYLPGAIYIENSNGTANFYHAYTDILGSLTALVNENGTVVERYAYDPWGKRRNPNNCLLPDDRTGFIINRGYTGHEHIDQFGIINMNGRVYDPLTASFFSPDPYVQAPDNWLNYNRYSYCLNNPFKYTDPSGNLFGIDDAVIAAVAMGAVINIHIQNMSGNLYSGSDIWKAAAIGALSGLAGYGAGNLVSNGLGTTTTLGGSILNSTAAGFAGGFAGGFVSGAGNAWANGANFGQGLKAGLMSGGIGAATGAVIGGVTGGLQYRKQMAFFHKGNDVLGVNFGDAVPQTDQFLGNAQKAWYPDAPMEHVDAFTTEHLSADAIAHFKATGADGITIPQASNGFLTGRSDMYFNSNAFSSARQLFFTMGHEFMHVSQFAYLGSLGTSVSTINDPLFGEMLEFHAYTYQSYIGGGTGMNSFEGYPKMWMTTEPYKNYFNQLYYFKFPWYSNHNFQYPF
jgi:RHS repeat-associated protein